MDSWKTLILFVCGLFITLATDRAMIASLKPHFPFPLVKTKPETFIMTPPPGNSRIVQEGWMLELPLCFVWIRNFQRLFTVSMWPKIIYFRPRTYQLFLHKLTVYIWNNIQLFIFKFHTSIKNNKMCQLLIGINHFVI